MQSSKYMYDETQREYQEIVLRDSLLEESDWTQMPDSPLSEERKGAWAEYRQELRDITKQEGFPNNPLPTVRSPPSK